MTTVLGHILPLPASPEPPTHPYLLPNPGQASCHSLWLPKGISYIVFQPEQCSWSCLNSTQIFLLHPAPWSAATSKGTACSPASGAGFLREVQGQARSQRGMLGEGLGPEICRRHTVQGGKTLDGCPSPSSLLAQRPGPARSKQTCWGSPGSCRKQRSAFPGKPGGSAPA